MNKEAKQELKAENRIYVPIDVNERTPKDFATIHVVLIDGRIPMMAMWRPDNEWWTLGMSEAKHLKKGVTHWLEPVHAPQFKGAEEAVQPSPENKYRKKPVVIEAIQWQASMKSWDEIIAMGCSAIPGEMGSGSFYIETMEGNMKASKGDWIIKGVRGEFYPCKDDIFAKTYEPVSSSPEPEKSNVEDKQEVEEVKEVSYNKQSLTDLLYEFLQVHSKTKKSYLPLNDDLECIHEFIDDNVPFKAASLPKEDEFSFIKERRENMPQEIKDKVKADFDERDRKGKEYEAGKDFYCVDLGEPFCTKQCNYCASYKSTKGYITRELERLQSQLTESKAMSERLAKKLELLNEGYGDHFTGYVGVGITILLDEYNNRNQPQ